MKLRIDTNSATPVFQQSIDQVHFQISTGELPENTKLPSLRTLASDHHLAINTVAKALRQLEFPIMIMMLWLSIMRI